MQYIVFDEYFGRFEMKIYIVGGQSRLVISLANKYEKDSLVLLDRSLYSEWSKPGAKDL